MNKNSSNGGRKVIVALRDAESVESLMELACHVSSGMKAELVAMHVIEVPPVLELNADSKDLDEPGKHMLSIAVRVANHHFGKVETLLIRAREVGPTILDEAKNRHADLLVMGYHHKPRVEDILLGSTVQYVTRHAPCRVIVEIPPLKHGKK